MSLIDALYLYEELAGHVLWSIAFAIFAALMVAAFSLGGAWALRGRAALATPTCSQCRASLRAVGTELPKNCPECGTLLTSARSVRWLRFRRELLTAGITAPVIALGGLTLGLAVAAWLVTTMRDLLLHRVPIVATKTVDSTLPPAQVPDSDFGSDAWLERPVRDVLAMAGPGVDPQSIDGMALWIYQARCRRNRYALPSAERLLDALAIAAFVEADVRRYWTTPQRHHRTTPILATSLVTMGDASPAWFARITAPPDVSQKVVLLAPLTVQPGKPLTIRLADVDPSARERSPNTACIADVSARAADGTAVHFDEYWKRGRYQVLPGVAPAALGPCTIVVTWIDRMYQTGGVVEAVVDVTSFGIQLPRSPFDSDEMYVSVAVWPLGDRDAIALSATDSTNTVLLGTWSIEIDGRWVPMTLTDANWYSVSGGVLMEAPRTPWRERSQLRVRYVSPTDEEVAQMARDLPTDALGRNAITMNASLASETVELELRRTGISASGPYTYIVPAR